MKRSLRKHSLIKLVVSTFCGPLKHFLLGRATLPFVGRWHVRAKVLPWLHGLNRGGQTTARGPHETREGIVCGPQGSHMYIYSTFVESMLK